MKENYLPWQVNPEDFQNLSNATDKLRFLINFAILAPSSHNSQPWKFRIEGNSILIYPEPTRYLPQSDKNDRQLYISLGCATENILIAADYYGYQTKVEHLPAGNCAVKIIFSESKPKSEIGHLIFSIPKRTNNRNPYNNQLPPKEFLNAIHGLSQPDVKIDFISDKGLRYKVAETAIAAGVLAMEDDNFREELSHYVKSNTTKSFTGMPLFGMGMPTPISYLGPSLIKRFNMNKVTRKKDEKLLKQGTPLFALISTKSDDKISWLKAGQVYERVALLAQQSGIKTAVWAAPIQIDSYYQDLQKILNIDYRPQVFFRMGYTNKVTRHSPRLSVNQTLQ